MWSKLLLALRIAYIVQFAIVQNARNVSRIKLHFVSITDIKTRNTIHKLCIQKGRMILCLR
jgi:hypothetical protein